MSSHTVVLPPVFFDHVCQFDDEFSLLVFLARFVGLFIFPAEGGLAAITVYVGNSM